MNLLLKNIKSGINEDAETADFESGGLNNCIAQFYVFCGEKYLGWDCFDKSIITVGKNPAADLVLSDNKISDIQAAFTISDDGIIVSNEGAKASLLVNDQSIRECTINPLDFIKIGKYTIKIKLKKINSEDNAFRSELYDPKKKKAEKEVTLEIVPDIDPALEKTLKVEKRPVIQEDSQKPAESSFSLDKTLEFKQKARSPQNIAEEKEIPVIVSPQESTTNSLNKDIPLKSFASPVHSLEEKTEKIPDKQETIKKPSIKSTLKQKTKETEKPAEEREISVAAPQRKRSETPSKENSFPPSFFNPVYDVEDNEEDEDDFPAAFSLKDKLTGSERNVGRAPTSNKLFEIIKLRGDTVVSINHLNNKSSHCLINQKNSFCSVEKKENDTACLFFTEPLLNKINITKNKKLETKKAKSLKSLTKRQNTYKAYLPQKGEVTITDGYYDYVLRPTFVADKAGEVKPFNDIPLKKRILQSAAFRNMTKAVIVHLVVLLVLSFTIEIPDIEEFKNPETHFVVVDTNNIHRPVKPKPKPKPKPVIPKKTTKIAKKKPAKTGAKVASLRKKPVKKAGKPKAGGGNKGNLVNRNVNQVGLLGALGLKTGITVKPNEALAAVTNIDAITSTHSREAKIKIGGIVGSLGDGNIAIPAAGVFNSKGSTNVLRSAGIGGDGSIAALEAGNTGQRAVEGTVSAPLTRKVRFKGGGISRDAVAKVINEHLDEISYCYESSLIGDPSLMGKVVFEWKILPSGKVGEVKIKSSTLRSSEIHSCIKSAIRTWRFPKPKGGAAIISYPFVFDVSGF